MEIKTKFNVGDEIFFLKDNQVQSAKVTGVSIEVGNPFLSEGDEDVNISYDTEDRKGMAANIFRFIIDPQKALCGEKHIFSEKDCYPSKEELLKAL